MADDPALDLNVVEPADLREPHVDDMGRGEPLELDPAALQQSRAESPRIRRMGDRAPKDDGDDVPVTDAPERAPLRRHGLGTHA